MSTSTSSSTINVADIILKVGYMIQVASQVQVAPGPPFDRIFRYRLWALGSSLSLPT